MKHIKAKRASNIFLKFRLWGYFAALIKNIPFIKESPDLKIQQGPDFLVYWLLAQKVFQRQKGGGGGKNADIG